MSVEIKSAAGLSRRFLNLILDNRVHGFKSLCSMGLEDLFSFTATPPQTTTQAPSATCPQTADATTQTTQAPSATRPQTADATTQAPSADTGYMKNEPATALMMQHIQIPSPHISFQASTSAPSEQWKIDCFPLSGSTVICADHLGRAFRWDAYSSVVETMPRLHKSKQMPISIFVPKSYSEMMYRDQRGCGSSLFVMERILKPEEGCSAEYSDQFEAIISCKPAIAAYNETWRCKLLPPPPFVRESKYCHSCQEISSYAVLDGGNQICISVHDVGTYCLDTENHTWSEVGRWTLPFRGKVEYVPELNLWFGFSAKDRHLAAADLSSISTMNSKPQLMVLGREIDPPEEWKECKDSQLVNLGAGMFSITRFFHGRTLNNNFGNKSVDQEFAVFTGVEVVPGVVNPSGCASSSGSEKEELRMTPHKSRCHTTNGTTIDAVF